MVPHGTDKTHTNGTPTEQLPKLKHHAMKVLKGMKVTPHAIYTLALDRHN
jgi:hypothetical protein